MTKNFSFRRLLLLIKKHWFENAKLYLYGTLALLGLLGIVFLFWLILAGRRYDEYALIPIFFIGLFLSGAIFASASFSMLGRKAKGLYWLSFPASHLEKLICLIFYNLIVFTAVYCLCFFLIERSAVSYLHHLVKSDPTRYSLKELDWNYVKEHFFFLRYFVYAFFAVQALYLLGSVYFRRYSFILTTIITAFVLFCYIFSMQHLTDTASFGINIHSDQVLYASQYESGFLYEYALNPVISNVLVFLVKFIWVPFFWLVTWFRLKEKEI